MQQEKGRRLLLPKQWPIIAGERLFSLGKGVTIDA